MTRIITGLLKILLWLGAIALVISTVLQIFFVDRAVVGHNGMAPTLVYGDKILIWKHIDPRLGDVLICENPSNSQELVLGRVAATAGMEIETEREQLIVAGTKVSSDYKDYLQFRDGEDEFTSKYQRGIAKFGNTEHQFFERVGNNFIVKKTKVPTGRLFLLGDNRTFVGQDSRYFGTVIAEACKGRVVMRIMPTEIGKALGHKWFDLIR